MRLSQTYADFNSELAIVLPYATANALRIGIIDTSESSPESLPLMFAII